MFATLEQQLAWAHTGTMAAHISVHRLAKLHCVGMNSTHSLTTTHQARLLKGILYITWEKSLISIYICCPNLEIIHEKVDINSSCEMEILIRQTAPDEPRVYFPIFANRGDGEQFERRFLGLFDSPGPAVLKVNHGITSSSNEILYFLKDVWTIVVISFLHAVLAGMIIWYLVCTSRHSFNQY